MVDDPILNSGHSIPVLGMGTYQCDDPSAAVQTALDVGYRHFDTAQMYGNEAGVGEGLRQSSISRDSMFITTKLNTMHHAPEVVHSTFATSLSDLRLEAVDLFLIHWPMPKDPTDYVDTWKALIEIQNSGGARSIGVSNFTSEHIQRLVVATGVTPAVNQIEIHPYFANTELIRHCQDRGIVVESWSPLGKGDELNDPVITEIANDIAKTPAQVILRWHLQRDCVVIPKSNHRERMEENMQLFDFSLSEEHMAQIDSLDKGEAGRRSPHPDDVDS